MKVRTANEQQDWEIEQLSRNFNIPIEALDEDEEKERLYLLMDVLDEALRGASGNNVRLATDHVEDILVYLKKLV